VTRRERIGERRPEERRATGVAVWRLRRCVVGITVDF
jgi:hypothetical protein